MKFRISCLTAVMSAALLVPLAVAKRGPYRAPVVWDGLQESFREIVRRAHTVAIVEVTKCKVKELGTMPPMQRTTVQFKNPVFLYGKETPKAPTVVRGSTRLAPGTKVIIAWWKAEEGTVLMRYSRANELAVRRVLVPGWHVAHGMLCPSCKGRAFPENVGKCDACAGITGSGKFALCAKCAQSANQCQACKRTISATLPLRPVNGGLPPLLLSVSSHFTVHLPPSTPHKRTVKYAMPHDHRSGHRFHMSHRIGSGC